MEIEQITKHVGSIKEKIHNFLDKEEKAINKINYLEQKMNNLQNFLTRPENISDTNNIEYKTAFSEYIRKGKEDNLIKKDFSNNDDVGGVLVISSLYNKIISDINALSPMRQLASVETISTNALDVVIEDGSFGRGWVAETAARDVTDTPQLKQKKIFVHEMYAQPKASQAFIDDSAINVETWLVERLRDSFVRLENNAFISGDGENKPKGLLSEDSGIESLDFEGNVSTESLLHLLNSLEEGYVANASFLMHRSTLSAIQKLKDNSGRFIWQQSLSDSLSQNIFGIPVICSSAMPLLGSDSPAIALGDFKVGYKILDRNGINLMRDPYTDKPFIKFYAVKRVGGDVVNPKAIKFAKFAIEANDDDNEEEVNEE